MVRVGSGRLPTGVDRVCLAYLDRFSGQARGVVMRGQYRRILGYSTSRSLFKVLLNPTPEGMKGRIASEVLKSCVPPWSSQSAEGAWSFYLGHWGLEKPGFAKWVRKTRQKPVYFVHDLIPLTHPEYCRPGESDSHAGRIRVAVETGAAILVNSRDTSEKLALWADGQRLNLPPVAVAPLAPAPLSYPSLHRRQLPRPMKAPYFVVLGTIEPRKNHLLLLELWRELVATMGEHAPHLVVIGQRGWECENVIDMLERCESLREHVHEMSRCSDDQLATYLKHAQALLFPSFVEGYGMPLVEALMLGTPVIASDLSVFREFAFDVPEWLKPIDGQGWMRAVLDYSDKVHPRRLAQIDRMRSWSAPTWGVHFEAVDALLEQHS